MRRDPITAARLISQDRRAGYPAQAGRELAQIDAHVSQAVLCQGGESGKGPGDPGDQPWELADQALQTWWALLIQSRGAGGDPGSGEWVYTDGKWACFLLGQLLPERRPLPQRPACRHPVRPGTGRRVELTVEDNGIGIPAHELPRIFDRGFTGSNGRSRGGSTGMGLYLAPEAGGRLEIELRAASEEERGPG